MGKGKATASEEEKDEERQGFGRFGKIGGASEKQNG